MSYEEEKPEYPKKFKIINKRKKVKIVVTTVVILSVFGAIGSLAYNAGFIPITGFLDVKEPSGTYVEINTKELIKKYPGINDMPNLDKIKYKAYGTDESVESIASYYEEELEKDGYSMVREGTAYIDGKTFRYYGFLKGITAVGILLTSDLDVDIGYNTMIIYTTGSAFDYKQILDWYQNKV